MSIREELDRVRERIMMSRMSDAWMWNGLVEAVERGDLIGQWRGLREVLGLDAHGGKRVLDEMRAEGVSGLERIDETEHLRRMEELRSRRSVLSGLLDLAEELDEEGRFSDADRVVRVVAGHLG